LISKTVTTLTGPSHKMAVLLDLMERYPDRFLPGTDYVASFGTHDDFPGYTPPHGGVGFAPEGAPKSPHHIREGLDDRAAEDAVASAQSPDRGVAHDRGGCHKTEMTHSEQVTDTSSLNMFFNDELFSKMVLGENFFRVAGLASRFAAPPLCRSDPSTPRPTTTAGWKPNVIASSGLRTQKPGVVASSGLRTQQVEPTSFSASFRPLNDGMDDPNGDGWARRHDLATYEIAAEEAFVDARYTNRARSSWAVVGRWLLIISMLTLIGLFVAGALMSDTCSKLTDRSKWSALPDDASA